MKIRNSFVSNSSSASFLIPKSEITEDQKNAILNFVEYYKEKIRPVLEEGDYWIQSDESLNRWVEGFWILEEIGDSIKGFCDIDNFGMERFFNFIGVSENYLEE